MWDAIGQIGSGLTLVAFLVSAAVALLRRRLQARERMLLATPENDRAAVIQALDDAFLVPALPVDPKVLTREQQYTLLLTQIRERSRRYLLTSVVTLVTAILIAAVTMVTLAVGADVPEQTSSSAFTSTPVSRYSIGPVVSSSASNVRENLEHATNAAGEVPKEKAVRTAAGDQRLVQQPAVALDSGAANVANGKMMTEAVSSGQKAPHGPVLKSARFLTADDGGILEISATNDSEETVDVAWIDITAIHPRLSRDSHCMQPDPIQTLELDWRAVASSDSDVSTIEAKTALAGREIRVSTQVSGVGRCNDYTFEAAVPVIFTIGPRESVRVLLSVKEIGFPPMSGQLSPAQEFLEHMNRSRISRFMPKRLHEWREITVGLRADVKIQPASIVVARDAA